MCSVNNFNDLLCMQRAELRVGDPFNHIQLSVRNFNICKVDSNGRFDISFLFNETEAILIQFKYFD